MDPNIFTTNLTADFSKLKIIKNLCVISLSFMFLGSGDEGLLMLQTTMNKKGVGTATVATYFITYGLTSLLFTSFIVKKIGSRNSQIVGIMLILPFIASNVYPMWITMLLSAVLRGVGKCLLWAAQCTYFNESSVLYCKIENNSRNSSFPTNMASKCTDTDTDEISVEFKSHEQKREPLSVIDLQDKTGETHCSISNRSGTVMPENISPVRLTAYKCKNEGPAIKQLHSLEKNKETTVKSEVCDMKIFNESSIQKTVSITRKENIDLCTGPVKTSLEKNKETTVEDKVSDMEMFNASSILKTASIARKEDIHLDTVSIKNKENEETKSYQSTVDSTKSLFFGIHGLVYNLETIWSSLISYYILGRGDTVNYNNASNMSCGASYCSISKNDARNNTEEEVPDNTRHLLIGVCMGSGIVAPLLMILFLDHIGKRAKNVNISWTHVLATISYIRKKDQLLLIPFTIGSSICRGFYMADFTKAYIACAWSTSHIGLITIIFGATSAFSSVSSGVLIKYVGRIPVLVLCQIITIANFVGLSFWNPNAQEPYMFYVQGCMFGMITGIFNSQTRAFYGILFEGDEATAFSSCNMYSSIGWTLPFIYGDVLCVSVKIYIILAFSFTGLIGYLLAERSYSLRNKKTNSSK